MYLKISADCSVSLEESDDFIRFSIVVAEPAPAGWQTSGPFSRLAEEAGDGHYWLDKDAVAALSPKRDDDAWRAAFNTMLNGAEPYGFYDSDRRKIKAHIVAGET